MKTKKLRGQKRIKQRIDDWVKYNYLPDIDYFNERGIDYLKCNIDPWNRLNLTWSSFPQPKGDFKRTIIKGLLAKYEIWENYLRDKIESYELRLVLHTEEISKCNIEIIKFEKEEKSKLKFDKNIVLDINGVKFNKFIWNKTQDYIYIGEDDIKYNSNQDFNSIVFDRKMRKRIKRNNYKKDEFGNYLIPNGYNFTGIKR